MDMKPSRRAEISVGEPWDFEGNDGPNRLLVDHEGWVEGPQEENRQSRFLLLRVVHPFEHRSERVEYVIASPRHLDVTPEMLAERGGHAGFVRVRPGVRLLDGDPFNGLDVDHFLIGGLAWMSGAEV
jgi:hypothetical protein